MPWNESTKMDEKLKFVSRFLDGEKIAPLCVEFGISRVTGHKIIERYKESGLEAFTDRSRRPFRQANRLPFQVEQLIINLKKEFPTWGAPKIRERMLTREHDRKDRRVIWVRLTPKGSRVIRHRHRGLRPLHRRDCHFPVMPGGLHLSQT